MRADHVFKVIDLHSAGAPSRLVLSGVPPLLGGTVMEKMQYFAANHDWIRRALVLEPQRAWPDQRHRAAAPIAPRRRCRRFFHRGPRLPAAVWQRHDCHRHRTDRDRPSLKPRTSKYGNLSKALIV